MHSPAPEFPPQLLLRDSAEQHGVGQQDPRLPLPKLCSWDHGSDLHTEPCFRGLFGLGTFSYWGIAEKNTRGVKERGKAREMTNI